MQLPPPNDARRLTEQRNPLSSSIDRATIPEALAIMQAEDRRTCAAAEACAPQIAAAIERVVAALRGGGRLIYVGAGTSGRLGVLDASEQPPTFNVPPTLVQGIIAGGPAAGDAEHHVLCTHFLLRDGCSAFLGPVLGPLD